MRAQEFIVENTDQAAVDALLKKHGWSMGRTANGVLAFTWQGRMYEFFGERVRITLPDGKSVAVVWGKKPDWQTRPGDISFAQAVQQKYLTFDLPIWQALDRRQINDAQAMQQFKAENERQAREAVAQGVTETINTDILNKRFRHTQVIGDYTYKASVEKFMGEPLLSIKAYDRDREIGHILFEIFHWEDKPAKSHIESGGTEVDPAYRNKGVASTMYAYAKMLGNDIRASYNQTSQGQAMWAAWEKAGNAKHLAAEGREKFNTDLMKPGFRWSEDINGITYLVRTRWDNMPEVVARVNNREVGRATFINHHTRSGLESVSTYVSPKWQGWGIAKNMYAVMRMLGANIQPSATQTAMGKDMWAKWKKGGDTKHLTSMNAKMDEQGVTEFAPAANDDNDKKAYLLQLARALGDAMYGPNKNKQAVLDIKSKIVDAGGDVKILWNDDGTFNVVMYHPTYFKQGYLIKLVGGQAPGSLSENKVESKLSVDVPNEEWLQDKIDYAKRKGRNSYGVPYMGSTTASVRGDPPRVRVMRLASLPGMRNEQTNVRRDDLKWLMDYMEKTGKLPPMGSNPNEEYLPYIMVAYNGEAWVNEGNHRIMAAYRLNWQDMPIEIRYFDGGERIENGPMAPGKIGLA